MPNRPFHRQLAGFLAAVVIAAIPVSAQQYQVEVFNEGDGLPSTSVADVAQDPVGRIWFATRAGVASYDGRSWTTYGKGEGLDPRARRAIVIDEQGRPWAASSARGVDVAVLDGDRWLSIPGPDVELPCRIDRMAVMQGTAPERLALAATCGLWWRGDGRWRRVGIADGLPADEVHDIVWNNGVLFVATADGLGMMPGGEPEATKRVEGLPAGPVFGLAADRCDGAPCTWIVGQGWIGRLEQGEFRKIASVPDIAVWETERRSAAADGNGGLFFGAVLVLYHYHPATGLRTLDESNGLASLGATGLLLDREGNTWIAAKRGVSRIAGFSFATFSQAQGLLDDEVTAGVELRDGRVVLGHRDGLTVMGPGGARTVPFRDSVPTAHGRGRVLDLDEGPDGTLWIAANVRGLGRYRNGRIEWTGSGDRLGVTSVLVDREGHVWYSVAKGVLVDSGEGFESRPLPVPTTYGVRRLIEGDSGAIYACTMGSGLYRDAGEGWEGWFAEMHPERNSVFAVQERPDGRLWVGAEGGLMRAEGRLLVPETAPAVDRPVYFILEDEAHRTWFGTDNGVLRWDGSRLDAFTVEDGLGGRETNRAAGFVDAQGRVWIGTTGGVTVYRPDFDRGDSVPPVVSLLGLEASGEDVGFDGPVRLPYGHNDLVFAFRAISFSDQRGVRLQSRLEGFENEWPEPYASADQLARYTNLSPGRYRFHVRAAGRAGRWSETVTSPEVLIVGPFWARPWFWGLTALLLGGVALAAYRHVYQARYAKRLEHEVQQRVEELHNVEAELAKALRLKSLGLLAGGIAHDFNNLLAVVLGNLSLLRERADAGCRRWVADAENAVERARELTGQLLTFSRGGAPIRNPARIDEVIRDSASFVMRGSKVRCDIDLPAGLRVVSIDAGQINQVMNNLLINALQSMPDGGTVRIRGRNVDNLPGSDEGGRYVAIEVRDEGQGILRDDLPRVFDPYFSTKESGSGLGLATAFSIVRRHEGLLTADSTPGAGSTFTFYLPASSKEWTPPPVKGPVEPFDGARVLVMDDDDDVRTVLVELLERLGCTVTASADGEEALFRYEQGLQTGPRYDAVILDLTVRGGMGGEEAMRRLLEMDSGVRAIVTSGYAHSPVMADHRRHGFKAVLRKPFALDAIADALGRTVGPRILSRPFR